MALIILVCQPGASLVNFPEEIQGRGVLPMADDLEKRLAAVEARLRELSDREELRDLRYRYHEYVNERKFGEIAGLFCDDGELDFNHGSRARFFARAAPDPFRRVAEPPPEHRRRHRRPVARAGFRFRRRSECADA